MAKPDDTSSQHFDWFVASRSRNQDSTLTLHKLIETHDDAFGDVISFYDTADQSIGAAFSLWRAVFLSNLTGDPIDQLADAKRFLRALVAHDSVFYQTDYTAREWSFRYYLDNAVHRIANLPEPLRPTAPLAVASGSAKDQWTKAQSALDAAVTNFTSMVEGS